MNVTSAASKRATRTTFAAIAAIMTVVASLGVQARDAHAALPPPPPAANPYVDRIVEISPTQATPGQVITIRTAQTEAALAAQNLVAVHPTFPGLTPVPGSVQSVAPVPKVFFGNVFGQAYVPSGGVTPLGNRRYQVVVPPNAHTGKLRYQTALGNSYSTQTLTVLSFGYSVVNLSQLDVISVKVDNQERLAPQTIPATPADDPDTFVADIGATSGNHSIQITLGASSGQPVIVYGPFPAEATNPTNEIQVGIMLAGEYLTASPNAITAGNRRTSSWQALVFGTGSIPTVNGFDFTFDSNTQQTTWTHWVGDRPNVTATGPVAEPADWPLNPTSLTLELRRANGSLFTTIVIDLLDRSFLAADGLTYELQ